MATLLIFSPSAAFVLYVNCVVSWSKNVETEDYLFVNKFSLYEILIFVRVPVKILLFPHPRSLHLMKKRAMLKHDCNTISNYKTLKRLIFSTLTVTQTKCQVLEEQYIRYTIVK